MFHNSDYLNSNTVYLIVTVILLLCCASTSITQSVHIKTNQNLSSACWKLIEDEGDTCPHLDLPSDISNWELVFNKICCQDYLNTTLHCQSDNLESGEYFVFPACLMDKYVHEGETVRLIRSKDNLPTLEVHPCSKKFFVDVARWSHTIRVPHCPKSKTTCLAEHGKQQLCDGGATRDNKCTCLQDYEPYPYEDCRRGFNVNDVCSCIRKICPVGSSRNISHIRPEKSCLSVSYDEGELDFTCNMMNKSSFSPDTNKSNIQSSKFFEKLTSYSINLTPETYTIPLAENENQSDFKLWSVILIILLLTLIIIIVVSVWYKRRQIENSSFYHGICSLKKWIFKTKTTDAIIPAANADEGLLDATKSTENSEKI